MGNKTKARNARHRSHIIRGQLLAKPGIGEAEFETGLALLGLPYERQAKIGGYFVDYLIKPYKIIVEIDGDNHKFSRKRDEVRENFMKNAGYTVIRVAASYAQSQPRNAAMTVLWGIPKGKLAVFLRNRESDFTFLKSNCEAMLA